MFKIAMNEPIIEANTATQIVRLARSGSAAGSNLPREVGNAEIEAEGIGFDMTRGSRDFG